MKALQNKMLPVLSAMWYPELDPGTERAIIGKTSDIWIKSEV